MLHMIYTLYNHAHTHQSEKMNLTDILIYMVYTVHGIHRTWYKYMVYTGYMVHIGYIKGITDRNLPINIHVKLDGPGPRILGDDPRVFLVIVYPELLAILMVNHWLIN